MADKEKLETMKELSIEEKAKRYDELKVTAQELEHDGCFDMLTLFDLFPELKESEDERIRKVIIEHFAGSHSSIYPYKGFTKEKIIAWLEKQGKDNMGISEATKQKLEDNLNKALEKETPESWNKFLDRDEQCEQTPNNEIGNYDHKKVLDILMSEKQSEQKPVNKPKFKVGDKIYLKPEHRMPDDDTPIADTIHEIIAIDDKHYRFEGSFIFIKDQDKFELVEQNPADKIEPKFKVGDRITDGYLHYKITDVLGDRYVVDTKFVKRSAILFNNESRYHLWTIEDAKDGDVLYSPRCRLLWIYKDEKTCHVGYNLNYNSGSIVINKPICIPTDVCPATKDEQTIIFTKMKEAGYEWDANKKELKKIENEIEIPFGAKDSELQETTYYIPKGFHAEINDDKVVIKKGEKPTAWSEEDEKKVNGIITILKPLHETESDYNKYKNSLIAWLKSLKERVQPKQEWSEEDENELAILRGYIISGEWSTAHISRALGIIDSIINKMTEK